MKKILSGLLALTLSISSLGMLADAKGNENEITYTQSTDEDSSSSLDESSQDESSEIDTSSNEESSKEESSSEESSTDDSSQTPVSKKNISECEITGVSNKTFTGNEIKQSVVVKDGTKTLTDGKDYSVSYSNNTKVGKAKVTITGKGEYQGTIELTFMITAPSVADIKSLKVSSNKTSSFKISWGKASGVTGYVIQNYHPSTKKWVTFADLKGTEYSVSNLKAGSVYKCRVGAYKTVKGQKFYGKYSNVDCVTLPAKTTKASISNVSEKGYTLNWNKISGVTEYKVLVYNSKTKAYDKIATTKSNSYKITGKKAGQKNTYKISGVKKYNNKSYTGGEYKCSFASNPQQVKSVSTKVKLNSLQIKWKKVDNADGYRIYYSSKKDKDFKMLKEIKGNKTFSYTTKSLAGKKVYIKIRAFSKASNATSYGKYSETKYVRIFANKTYNQIINGYKNSNSVTLTNGQGYKISNAKKNELKNALTYLGGTASFAMLDLESGAMVGFNSNTYMGTASTVKMPYMLYALKCMEDGKPSMNTKLTYKRSDYSSGSSVIVNSPFGTKFSLKTVFHDICAYSDNCGYYMLQDYFGYTGYNKFISSLGCRTSVSPYIRWGVVSAADSTKEWIAMYDYLYNGKYGSFMRNELKKSTSSNFRIGLGGKYTVYSKCGWTDTLHHDTAVVEAEHPYVLICLTNRVNAYRLQRVARAANAIHDEMWKYYNKK